MPTYVTLSNWTEQGVRTAKETVERAEKAGQIAQQMGGSLREIFWTVGPYDVVVVGDFPDDQSASAFVLAVAAQGNIKTLTMRAFNADEARSIVDRLP